MIQANQYPWHLRAGSSGTRGDGQLDVAVWTALGRAAGCFTEQTQIIKGKSLIGYYSISKKFNFQIILTMLPIDKISWTTTLIGLFSSLLFFPLTANLLFFLSLFCLGVKISFAISLLFVLSMVLLVFLSFSLCAILWKVCTINSRYANYVQ